MNRFTITIICAAAGAFTIGCGAHGATTAPTAATAEVAPITESELYAEAVDEAFEAFENDVSLAYSVEYSSEAEVEAVARTVNEDRFDTLLAASLARRGLTIAGLAAWGEDHPDFVRELRIRHYGELWRLRAAARGIAQIEPGPQMVVVVARPTDSAVALAD